VRTCSICTHAEREKIDRALIDGESERGIAGRFGLSKSAVDRHKGHLRGLVVAHSQDVARTLQDDISTAQLRAEGLYRTAENILACAVKAGDAKTAMSAVRTATQVLSEARNLMELRGGYEAAQTQQRGGRDIDNQLETLIRGYRDKVRREILAELRIPDVQVQ
jgi:hypothetical protein